MTRSGVIAVCFLLACLVGCGGNYYPPDLGTTGFPAAPLGQVVDVDVALPLMLLEGAQWAGVELELHLEIDGAGFGELPARVTYGLARYDRQSAPIEDLSNGVTSVLVTADDWLPGRLGPLRVDGTVFDLLIQGETTDGGWTVSGAAYETRSATEGTVQGWRRQRFLVAGSDFFSEVGRVALVELVRGGEIRTRQALELISSDAIVRVTGSGAFAVNRFTFDNVQRLDPSSAYLTSWQASVGGGANPHDVLALGEEKVYVSRYEPPYNDLAVIHPQSGRIVGTVPLESLAENTSGTPRPDRMALAEQTLFVGLQDIDRTFSEFEEGKLAVIDPQLDEVVGVIPLGGKNPGSIEVLQGEDGRQRLYVALSGIFEGLEDQELSGGVVVVDALDRAVERVALEDDAIGNISALALASKNLGYVVATDAGFTNHLYAFDPASAEVLREVLSRDDYIPEIEVDSRGVLAVPDRSFFQPELCLYRTPRGPDELETLIGCGPLELPPFSVEALD